jgi:hypothetical protein
MTRKSKSAIHAVPPVVEHPAVTKARKAGAPVILCGLCGDTVNELCDRGTSTGMDKALALEKASPASALSLMSSSYLDMWKNLFWYPAALSSFWGAMAQAYETCSELQMHWLGLLTPHTEGEVAGELETTAPTTKKEEEEMEHGIDVAVENFEDEILA